MLAEFDPYAWDEWIFIGGAIALIAAFFIHRKWARDKVKAAIDEFPTSFPNLTLTYWHDDKMSPIPQEVDLANRVFSAARVVWPELNNRISKVPFNIWFIRGPLQRVGWWKFGGIQWKDIPLHNQIPERAEGQGYGGLATHSSKFGTCYIATFFPARSPEMLLAHELTHVVTNIRNDPGPDAEHPPEFDEYEKRLIAELEKK